MGAYSTLDRIFIFAGAIGAFAVLMRMAALFAGGDGDDLGDGDDFRILSIHGLSTFLMMFGLVGVALTRQSGAGVGLSLLGGALAGLAAIWIMARLFRLALRFQSSGTIPSQAATGCLGTVYLHIPAGGTGRVNVRIGQRLREMDAVDAAGGELSTGTPVRVIRVQKSLAVVQPVSSSEM